MFTVIVIAHEWGHYITAKKYGVLVHEFAVGMGPVIWSKQKGETKYSLRLFPIGGYCSMEEENGESKNPRAMASKKPWQKLIIVSAGAVMNFLLACLILIFVTSYTGYAGNVVETLEPNMPAIQAGLMQGDRVIAIDGYKVDKLSEISQHIVNEEKDYTLTIERDGSEIEVPIKSKWMPEENRARFGFTSKMVHNNIWQNIKGGVLWACDITVSVVDAFVQLFTGVLGMDEVSSIVGVVDQTSEIWDSSVEIGGIGIAIANMMILAAALSANLAVVNLFPLPALDGGRIIFILVELLRGKPVSQDKEGFVHFIGFVLLMVLTVVLIFKDVMRLGA